MVYIVLLDVSRPSLGAASGASEIPRGLAACKTLAAARSSWAGRRASVLDISYSPLRTLPEAAYIISSPQFDRLHESGSTLGLQCL